MTLRARIFDTTGAHWPFWLLLVVVMAAAGASLVAAGVALTVLAMGTAA